MCNNIQPIHITEEVRSHLSTHFSAEGPGSKFYADSPESIINEAVQLFPEKFRNVKMDPDGRIRISLTFPHAIGQSNVVKITDLTFEERAHITPTDRHGYIVRTVKTDRNIPTCECQIVLTSNWYLVTMYPGIYAPPLPHSSSEPSDFWNNHVFIV